MLARLRRVVDPAEEFHSGYLYVANRPVIAWDPNGESTVIDSDGNVLWAYDDGDNSIFMATTNDGGKTFNVDLAQTDHKTLFPDEFIVEGNVMKSQIDFNLDFGPILDSMIDIQISTGMPMTQAAKQSRSGQMFDFKSYNKLQNMAGTLNGVVLTSRSLGNYFAGFNAGSGTILGIPFLVSFKTFQKMAGAQHFFSTNHRRNVSSMELIDIYFNGTSYGHAPEFGEINYQYRWSKIGFERGRDFIWKGRLCWQGQYKEP
jgi:hypothetical protein